MLESKQFAHFGYSPNFYVPKHIKNLVKKGLAEVGLWLLPEDTTDKADPRRNDLTCLKRDNLCNAGKVMFWVVVAIGITLSMGQLK
jgi:hypothetical protein